MVFRVRCFLCGAHEARIILGGREIIHAKCQSCGENLLAEVLSLEAEAEEVRAAERMRRRPGRERQITTNIVAVKDAGGMT